MARLELQTLKRRRSLISIIFSAFINVMVCCFLICYTCLGTEDNLFDG